MLHMAGPEWELHTQTSSLQGQPNYRLLEAHLGTLEISMFGRECARTRLARLAGGLSHMQPKASRIHFVVLQHCRHVHVAEVAPHRLALRSLWLAAS